MVTIIIGRCCRSSRAAGAKAIESSSYRYRRSHLSCHTSGTRAGYFEISEYHNYRNGERQKKLLEQQFKIPAAQFRLFSSSSSPLLLSSFSKATGVILKSDDKENNEDDCILTDLERELRASFQSYHETLRQQQEQEEQQQSASRTSSVSTESAKDDGTKKKIITSLEAIRDCFMKLEYWEDALQIEQTLLLETQQDGENTNDRSSKNITLASNIFRQGKLYMRIGKIQMANQKYEKAYHLFQTVYNNSNDNTVFSKEGKSNDKVYHADLGNVLVATAGVFFEKNQYDECYQLLVDAEPHFRNHYSSTFHNLDNGNDNDDKIPVKSPNQTQQPPHIDLVKCLDNQGLILRNQNNFQLALQKYKEALAILENHIDNNNNDNVHTDNNRKEIKSKRLKLRMHIADMLGAIEQYDQAIEYYRSIMEDDDNDYDSIDGDNTHAHSNNEKEKEKDGTVKKETALDGVILHSIGKLHAQQGKLELALTELEKALKIKIFYSGDMSMEVGQTLNSLGAVHGVLGNKSKALVCFQKALVIERKYKNTDTDDYANKDNADTSADAQMLHIMRNISILKGESVPKWGDRES